jgi:hypothetical protein
MFELQRNRLLRRVESALSQYPVTLLLGPRQCGKTTLARQIHAKSAGTYFDLEDPSCALRASTAKLILEEQRGLVVIDEFQRQPELLPVLRVLADRSPGQSRFLILGSASLDLVRGVSESLAGRVAYVDMGGFDLEEVGAGELDRLWLRGTYPPAFTAANDDQSFEWRVNLTRSLLERDIPLLGLRTPAETMRRFWTMLAHYHGQVWNGSELARALGTKEDTARRYLDILTGLFLVRQLRPWFLNVGKRLVKSPKVYLRDSGLLHSLLGLRSKLALQSHPKLGASWEGFAVETILSLTGGETAAHFYATHGGAELDLLLERDGRRYGFEFKYDDAPRPTKSMHVVIGDLGLEKLWIVCPGGDRHRLTETIEVLPLRDCPAEIERRGWLR